MNIFLKRSILASIASSVLIGSFALAGTAFANGNTGESRNGNRGQSMRPAVVGTVASVSGNTLTVAVKDREGERDNNASTTALSTTYTVDATNAVVTKNGTASTISVIAVGDTVIVQGTVSGTNSVTATAIRDTVGMMKGRSETNAGQKSTVPPPIQGNGQPVIGGSVTAVNGTALTVTTKSGIVYSVDATLAKITKLGVTSATLSNVVTGDTVVVQGMVSGTSVTASSIIDQGAVPTASSGSTPAPHRGFFGAIGNFFTHLFGF